MATTIPKCHPAIYTYIYNICVCMRLALSYFRAHGLHVVVPRFFIHLAPRGVESLALHDFARQVAMVERGLLSPPVLRPLKPL